MKAAVLDQPNTPLDVTDVDVRDPGPGEVLVGVRHCGVCHSDLSVIDGLLLSQLPVVLGHEAAGVIEAVGPGVTSVAEGDQVVLTPLAACGRCYFCMRGEPGVCVDTRMLVGSSMADGTTPLSRDGKPVWRGLGVAAFAERAIMTEQGVAKVAPDIPLDVACVIGCAVQTGVGAVLNTAGVEAGATVLVIGGGGIGLSIVQGSVVAGAATIVLSDPVAERRAAAERFGATHTVDPTAADPGTLGMDLTGGIGFDYCFEAVGNVDLVTQAISASRPGGTIVMVGAPPMEQTLQVPLAVAFGASERKLVGCLLGSCNSARDIPRLLGLWKAGRLDLEGLVTERRPLADINLALDDLRAAKGIRTVLDVT